MHVLTAQQIDQLEAQRDSDEALARALAYAKEKRAADRARVDAVEIRHLDQDAINPFINAEKRKANREGFRPWHGRTASQYTAFGQTKTLKEWAVDTGLHIETLRRRLRSGSTIEQALTGTFERGNGPTPKLYTLDGESLTLEQWAERIGATKPALATRLSKGWTLERTLTTPLLAKGRPRKRDRGEGRSWSDTPGTGEGSVTQDQAELGFLSALTLT